MWHFRNDHREFNVNPFKKKSTYNPKGDTAIEMYLSRLEEEIFSLDKKISSSSLTKGGKKCFIFATWWSLYYYKRSWQRISNGTDIYPSSFTNVCFWTKTEFLNVLFHDKQSRKYCEIASSVVGSWWSLRGDSGG